jgi:hypothetical protein
VFWHLPCSFTTTSALISALHTLASAIVHADDDDDGEGEGGGGRGGPSRKRARARVGGAKAGAAGACAGVYARCMWKPGVAVQVVRNLVLQSSVDDGCRNRLSQ